MSRTRTALTVIAATAAAGALTATSFAFAAPHAPAAVQPGVVRMYNINLEPSTVHHGTSPAFVGKPVNVTVTSRKTSALVTATLDFYSTDGKKIDADLAACYAKGSAKPHALTRVEPNFVSPASSYFAQSVSGAVGNLVAGTYRVGVCTWYESTNVGHGHGTATVEVVQAQGAVASH